MLQTVAVTQGFKEITCEAHHVPQLTFFFFFFSRRYSSDVLFHAQYYPTEQNFGDQLFF